MYNVFQIRYQVQQDIQLPKVGNSDRMNAQVQLIDTTLLKCYIKVCEDLSSLYNITIHIVYINLFISSD